MPGPDARAAALPFAAKALLAVLVGVARAACADELPKEWLEPQAPVRLLGSTYYVGSRGLSSILIVSDEGHVLIDGGLPQSVPIIVDNIRRLGFRLEDVKTIVLSHAHFDHAGGIAELQRLTGAEVVSSKSGAAALRQGHGGLDDPQFNSARAFPAVEHVSAIEDGETLQVGHVAITGHSTPGHTPGGMSWSWHTCERLRCANFVYADSLTAVADEGFRFSDNPRYRGALGDFSWSFYILRNLRCDILLTPHPAASNLWHRLAERDAGKRDALFDTGACRAYASRARRALDERLERERAQGGE